MANDRDPYSSPSDKSSKLSSVTPVVVASDKVGELVEAEGEGNRLTIGPIGRPGNGCTG